MTNILMKFLAPPACLKNYRIFGCMCQLWHLICLSYLAFERRVWWHCEVAYYISYKAVRKNISTAYFLHVHHQSVWLLYFIDA